MHETKEQTMKRFVVMLLVTALAGAASADIFIADGLDSLSVKRWEAWITDPVPVGDGSEDLISFTIEIRSIDPLEESFDPAGFDGTLFSYTGLTQGAANAEGLHQHYSPTFTPGVRYTADTGVATYPTAIDTHFLDELANMTTITDPFETVGPGDSSSSAEATDAPPPFDTFAATDFGDELNGTFAIDRSDSGVWAMAQIVIPDPGGTLMFVPYLDPLSQVDAFFAVSGGDANVGVTKGTFQFGIGVPEPATMSLLVLGGLGLIRRRR